MCQHKFGCYENVLRGCYRSFLIALGLKSLLLHLPQIVKPFKLLKNLININKNLDSVRFALFIGLMNGLYKAVLCFMRRFCKDDKKNAFIAGFIAGLTIIIDHKDRRLLIALIFLSRAGDTLLNMLDSRGIFKKFKYGELIPWVGAGTFTMYCMGWEPELLNAPFRKFY